jgi:hypothetical protein
MSCPPLPPGSACFNRTADGIPYWRRNCDRRGCDDICLEPRTEDGKKELALWLRTITSDGVRLWIEEAMCNAQQPTLMRFFEWLERATGDYRDTNSVRRALEAADAWMQWRPPHD